MRSRPPHSADTKGPTRCAQSLSSLNLGWCKVGDETISRMSTVRRNQSDADKAGASPLLLQMHALKHLRVPHTSVSDDGLRSICKQFGQVRYNGKICLTIIRRRTLKKDKPL